MGGMTRLLWHVGRVTLLKTLSGCFSDMMKCLKNGFTGEMDCREMNFSSPTHYVWCRVCHGLSINAAKELEGHPVENAKFKSLYSIAKFQKFRLREIAKGEF